MYSYKRKEDFETCTTSAIAQEALYMHQYWNERYLILMMSWVDDNKRIEQLINKAEESRNYWLDRYNLLTTTVNVMTRRA